MGIINFIKRAFVGDQTTGRLSYQKYQGLALTGINGNGGITVIGQVSPIYPAGIAVGPTHKLNDPSVTGNDAFTLYNTPLTDNRSI